MKTPVIELDNYGFKAYCKKRDMKTVMETLKGAF